MFWTPRYAFWPALGLLACLCLLSCKSARVVGTDKPVHEACGNGMDDDDDDLIDEGCPCAEGESQACFGGRYPHRLVGLCRDGLQHCELAPGDEFGLWGHCVNDVEPLPELCQSEEQPALDEDCDGAIDEGCGCEPGGSRACGQDFISGLTDMGDSICRAGTQTCSSESVWGHCEGAVGPGPELCVDERDNDCDGEVDEGCGCIPAPEVCGDGVDNDCDGVADEGCTGTCSPGCATSTLSWSRVLGAAEPHLPTNNRSTGVWTGDGMLFALGSTGAEMGHQVIGYDRSGLASAPTLISPSSGEMTFVHSIFRTAEAAHLISLIDPAGATTQRWRLHNMDLGGRPSGESMTLAGLIDAAAGRSDELIVVFTAERDDQIRVQRYTPDLSPGAETVLNPTGMADRGYNVSATSAIWAGSRWLVAGRFDREQVVLPGNKTVRFWSVDEVGVQDMIDVPAGGLPGQGGAGSAPGAVQMAAGPEGVLACWAASAEANDVDLWCQRFDPDGALRGSAWRLATRHAEQLRSLLMVYWQCRFLVISVGLDASGSWAGFVSIDGSVEPIELPQEVLSGSLPPNQYWSNAFSSYSAGPPETPFMMQGRGDSNTDRRHSLVQLSCPGSR